MVHKRLALLSAAALACVASGPADAATLAPDTSGFSMTDFSGVKPGVRFRARNTGDELFVGRGDLGVAGNRSAADFTYSATSPFSITYVPGTSITATYGAISRTYALTDATGYNAIRLLIRGPRAIGGNFNYFQFQNLTVNGVAISPGGTVSGPTSGPNLTDDFFLWNPAGGTATTLAGTLVYAGPNGNGNAETAKVDITFGTVTPVPLPPALAGLALGVAGIAGLQLVRRRRT